MTNQRYKYVIVGAGLAGVSAISGIREIDQEGPILLAGDELYLPYDRPPLSKKLWFGKKKVEDIFLKPTDYYDTNRVIYLAGVRIKKVETKNKRVLTEQGITYEYDRLLLATGGTPRRLDIPGNRQSGIYYYRYLDDYLKIREEIKTKNNVLVIGGGFIGSEIAAALNMNSVKVAMVFPEPYLCSRVFPENFSKKIQDNYQEKGIRIFSKCLPNGIEYSGTKFVTYLNNKKRVTSDLIIVGAGIQPSTDLAEGTEIHTENGIVVDAYLQTSVVDIYAAGDNCRFPYTVLGVETRIEHWDNAINQGKTAGRNMAGARETYSHMPFFFSDLFDIGYEAVGEVNAIMETKAYWEKENEKGIIYYIKDGTIKGALMCNVWDKVEEMRDKIKNNTPS